MLLTALTGAAALLLVVAGIAKLRTPAPAAAMLTGLGLRPVRRARAAARGAGAVEVAVGVAAIVLGGHAAIAALAACYLVLTAVAVRLVLRGEPAPCGCFGTADGDVGPAHVVLDVAAFAVALVASVAGPAGITGWGEHGALTGLTAAGQAALVAALGYLSITALPALTTARRALEN